MNVILLNLLQAFNFPTYGKLLAILAVGVPLVVSPLRPGTSCL